MELLQTLSNTPDRIRQQLTLQITLGNVLGEDRGFAAPEIERAFAQARQLCQNTDDPSQRLPVLRGLAGFYLNRGDVPAARELAEQFFALAQHDPDPNVRSDAHYVQGLAAFFHGETEAVPQYMAQCLALNDPQQASSWSVRAGGTARGF